jgi:hypothetical protein
MMLLRSERKKVQTRRDEMLLPAMNFGDKLGEDLVRIRMARIA